MLLNFYGNFWLLNFSLLTDGKFCFDSGALQFFCLPIILYVARGLHENRVKFPEERNAFVLDLQHGRRDVKCKPTITLKPLDTFLKICYSRD